MTWTEVNLWPTGSKPVRGVFLLLLDVADPLVHTVLRRDLLAWHYFTEDHIGDEAVGPHLRLRLLWRGRTKTAKVAAYLDRQASVSHWHEGSHGVRAEQYIGEQDEYGAAWEATYLDWMSSAELGLIVIRLGSSRQLSYGRQHHCERRLHLTCNQFGCDDIPACLTLAYGYLGQRHRDNPAAEELMAAIDKYLWAGKESESA